MSFEEVSNTVIKSNNMITATALIKMDGSILYQTNNWQINGGEIINAFKNKESSITIQGIKYSVLDVNEDRLIATNVSGKGHIVGVAVDDKALFIAYVSGEGDPRTAYIEMDRAARQINKML
ncbi:MAG: profilin family protein [Candidatus Odinarchaeia archaeon]